MSGDPPQQPRQPRNVRDLLRFCAEAGANEDNTETRLSPMSDERREWLQTALMGMTTDHVSSIRQHLSVVQTSQTISEREAAIEELTDLCDNLDFAKDFHKIGGYEVVTKLFTESNPGIRSRTFELVGTLVQNNEYCQLHAINNGWLPMIMEAIDKDENDAVKIKALFALSCLVRNDTNAQSHFTNHDGFSVLMRAMHTGVDKLKIKAAFLLTSLTNEQPAFKDTLCDIGMVDQLVGNLMEEHSATHEHLMSALLALVTDNERAMSECRRPELNLGHMLQKRVKMLEGKDEYLEEKQYAQSILEICFAEENSGQDR